MALSIEKPETERLARLVAEETGESITDAIEQALRERLERLPHKQRGPVDIERLLEIANRVAALPRLDHRPADVILGYDEHGLPR